MYAVARVAGGCQSPRGNPHRAPLFASANKQDNCAGQKGKGSAKRTETGGSRRESKRGWWTREGFCRFCRCRKKKEPGGSRRESKRGWWTREDFCRFCRCRKKTEPALHALHAADSENGKDVGAGRLFSGLLAGAPQT